MTSEKVVFFCFWELSVFVFQLGIMTFKATKTWGKTAQLIQLFSLGVKNNRLNQLSNIKQTVRSSLEILHIYIYKHDGWKKISRSIPAGRSKENMSIRYAATHLCSKNLGKWTFWTQQWRCLGQMIFLFKKSWFLGFESAFHFPGFFGHKWDLKIWGAKDSSWAKDSLDIFL